MIAAFLRVNDEGTEWSRLVSGRERGLPTRRGREQAERLPSYMVPDVYFAVEHLPMTVSGKTDRRRLREIGASFSAQQLAEIRTARQRIPEAAANNRSRENDAAAMGTGARYQAGSIGLDDSLSRLGGDSIAAMKLVGEARRMGLQLTVADLFRNPQLVNLHH